MDSALARALWDANLHEPAAPAAALARDLADGLPYGPLLTRMRQLARHGLPVEPAMKAALAAHPASIDLALVAVRAGAERALEILAERIAKQNRRRAALAWALWSRGEADTARAALADLDPRSDTFHADHAARAELAILSGEDPGPLDGLREAQLGLLRIHRREGAAALARRVDDVTLPDDPGLWSWLVENFIAERDFPRARAALDRLARLKDPDAIRGLRIRLALECEDITGARALLDAEPDRDAPWLWPSQRLVHDLRCRIDEASGTGSVAGLTAFARAAERLEPGHGMLTHLRLSAEMMSDPWEALARALPESGTDPGARATGFARLGLPDAALDALDRAAPGAPDQMARQRLRRAELHLMRGAPADAQAALGPAPTDAALRPADAYWRAEIALARGDAAAAMTVVTDALALSPTQMGLHLQQARAQFLAGDFAAALHSLDRFRSLKTAHLGSPPQDDLRDRITADAARAQARGIAEIESPGLAARALALAPPAFVAVPHARVPRRLAHYWEGPANGAIPRGLRAWAHHHPGFEQRRFDAATAAAWLAKHASGLSDLFARLTHPATRADLFRLAWIAHEGGVFADLDEFPREPVTPWLKGARAVLVIEQGHGTIANNFLAAEPGLPLFRTALDRVTRALRETHAPYPWWHSGPAQLTPPALAAARDAEQAHGLRFLTQMDYNARVSTNLPFPQKRGPDHWR